MKNRLVSILLSPASLLYRIGTVIDRRWKSRACYRSSLPVISIGNISVGGSGKTQITRSLLKRLQHHRPVIVLSRGYGRSQSQPRVWRPGEESPDPAQLGDEPAMLAADLQRGAIAVASDRASLLRHLESEFPDAIVLLDDGFQHHRLARDIDIVIVDDRTALSSQLLPAGRLREHPSALRRADILLCDSQIAGDFARSWAPGTPVSMIRQQVVGLVHSGGGATFPPSGSPLLVTGIARPERVSLSLQQTGVVPAGEIGFPDHHRYSSADIRSILEAAHSSGADWIVTTGKDAVKLGRFQEVRGLLYVLDVEMVVDDIDGLVARILHRR